MPNRARPALKNPLAPSVYLRRNAGKTVPLVAVIMLAVMLVAGIIALIDSIPFSIRTIYRYSQQSLGLTPRGDATQTQRLVSEVRKGTPVPIERIVICRASSSQVKSIVGKWPFVILGLNQPDMSYYLRRLGMKSLVGRLPKPGEPEALISRKVATNLGLKLFDPKASQADRAASLLMAPENNESYSPKYVHVVGIAEMDDWTMLTSIEYQRANHFPPIDLAMIFAPSLAEQAKLDSWAIDHFKGQRAQVFAFKQIEKNTDEMFKTLYLILNVVIGILVLVITFMMGMLISIYQSQRLVEFGLLQAIGFTKQRLLKRVVLEIVLVTTGGWVLGVLAAYGLLNVLRKLLMEPRAFGLDVLDPVAFMYTVPLPIAILLVALGTVVARFRRFDPVGVVERRLV